MSMILIVLSALAIWAFVWMLPTWRWSACTCGRERLPWFARRHEREWILWGFVLLDAFIAAINALTGNTVLAVLLGLFMVHALKAVIEHRKGKRSVLGRLLGRVTFNSHGRLVVEP